jgi:hypothetical protein
MPIDPSIALGYRGIEAPNPLAQYAQVAQIQNAQNQNALAQYQLGAAQRTDAQQNALNKLISENYDQNTGQINMKGLTSGLAAAGQGSLIPAQLAKQQELEGKVATTQKAKIDVVAEERKFVEGAQRNLSTNPSNANITAWLEDSRLNPVLSAQTKTLLEKEAAKLLAMKPADRATYLGMQGATTGDIVSKQNNAATVGATIRGQNMTDARARENIQIARERLAKDGATLDPAENAALSKAILEGRLDPNKVNGRNAKILATTLLANPNANILELGVSASGATAAERSLATQTAKMSTAANEANDMVAVVRDLSGKVSRTEFPTINAITNAVSKGTGGKEIVQLNASINALVNSYARAISPTGQPTVSDKNHAREVINSAYSTGQIDAILDVMQQEMSIARKSAGTASTELKESREVARGRGSELQGVDKQALEWANANPTDERAKQIKQRLGVK